MRFRFAFALIDQGSAEIDHGSTVSGPSAAHRPLGPTSLARISFSSNRAHPGFLCSIFRLVDVLADKRHHVSRTSYTSQPGIEDEFRHSRGCLDLGLENIRLQRVQETLLEQLGWHLIRHRLPSLNEHLVRDALRLRSEDRHTDRREYVEIVRLPRQK